MDDDVAGLVREQRLVAAAELASSRGDPKTASMLFERACDFRRAAVEAIKGRDFARALPLALDGKDPALAAATIPEIVKDANQSERVAYHLERRGDHLYAARIYEGIGKRAPAALAYERGGDAVRAASMHEADGDVAIAAKVLEAQVRREPARGDLLVALGALLLRYDKVEAAVRMLQKVRADAPERREAVTLLVSAFDRLAMHQAKIESEHELTKLGGAVVIAEGPAVAVRARLFGRYDVVREVASSPSARVLECNDGVRSEKVAVKIFAAYDARGGGRDALARFEREVRVLGTLDHPNVVPLRDYVPEGPALVLAWMTGGTLEQMLAKEPLTPMRAVEIARAVLGALGEAHRLGVIHRDVKPANVLFDDAGVTRLGDFGVAHLSDLSSTATAGVIGTLGYMSPEQREGRPATVKSDVYGVGAILWEMLTEEKPQMTSFEEENLRVRPSAVHRDLDARHDSLVLSLLSAHPDKRPDDAFAARKALGSLVWPNTIERAAAPRTERPKSIKPEAARLLPQMDGSYLDTWLDRKVMPIPLDATSLARASAFARADHAALQSVLRIDREDEQIWLAIPRGHPPAQKLTPAQSALLREAVERLHTIGGVVHGAIDPMNVLVDEVGAVMLRFTSAAGPTATADLDRLAVARL